MIHLYDTAAGAVLPLEPRRAGEVSMYVCGPTVYGPPHLGHGRFSLVFDVLRRYLIWSGLDVTYVSNITDIEDKILQRAADEGVPWQDVTERYERVWFDAMDAIGVLRPDHVPHATEYVEQMVEMIGELLERSAAYTTDDGVYLSVEQVEGYGLLAHQSLEDMRAGGGDRELVGTQKRHPADFVLWKFAKPGEPSWPSPWGEGRPGWHTECVVMSLDLLGEDFDLHGGGMDLAFPHHENERAQAVALGKEFSRRWAHNGFVEVAGEKMSKSLGNFTTLTDLIDRHDPRAYRLLVLQSHYRSPLEVTAATIDAAEATLGRLDALARRGAPLPAVDADADELRAFSERMDDNLDTPAVCAQAFGLVTDINSLLDAGEPAGAAPLVAALHEILGAVGLVLDAAEAAVPEQVAELARRRDAARAAKDWATADALRDGIVAAGFTAEDGPDGTVVRPA